MLKVIGLVLLVSVPAHAEDWFCHEASSEKVGAWITTCGTATSSSEDQARVISRERAIEEFKRVCAVSKDCRDFDFVVVPKRTECITSGNSVTCIRAMEFEILEVKREVVAPNVKSVQEQIEDHNIQIEELQKIVEKSKEEKIIRRELAMVKQDLNQETGEGKPLYISDSFDNSVKVDLKFWDGKLTQDNETESFLNFSYERRPKTWLGLQAGFGFGQGSFKNESDDISMQRGKANTSERGSGEMNLIDLNVAALGYTGFKGTYVKVEAGSVSGSRKVYNANYNSLGTATVKTSTEQINKTYTGASLGFDTRDSRSHFGMFAEVGFRNATSVGIVGSVGLNIGF